MKAILSFLIGLVVLISAAHANDYPSKQVTIVVPFSPGGGNDMVARFIGDALAKMWDKPVLIENRPGAGTALGSAYVSQAKPDGHTLLLASTSYATIAAWQNSLPFNPIEDLEAVVLAGEGDQLVIASQKLNISSLEELVDLAKSRKVFYGVAGIGSNGHFYGSMFAEAVGIELIPVPYPGGSEALVDLVAGRVDLVIGAYTTSERPEGVVPLVQLSRERLNRSLPHVPTIVEEGYPDAVGENYWAIFVPGGTPPEVVAKVHDSVQEVMNSPEGREFLAKLDARPSDKTSIEAKATIVSSIERWKALAERQGLRPLK